MRNVKTLSLFINASRRERKGGGSLCVCVCVCVCVGVCVCGGGGIQSTFACDFLNRI